MTVYLLNLFSVPLYALFLYFAGIDNRKKHLILCGLAGLQLFLTAALRATTVGGDLENYIPLYFRLGREEWSEVFAGRIEPGYLFLNKILTLFSRDERLLLVVVGGIVVTGFCVFIYRNSRILWLSLFLFVALGIYTTSLSMLRQSVALVFTLLSIRYVEQRSFWKFSILVSIAVLFHYTAITFFILYPLARFKPTWGYFLCMLGGGFVCARLFGKVLLIGLIERYYSTYEGAMAGGTGYNMLLLLIVVTAFGLFSEGGQKYDRRRNILTHMMILACCFQCMALHFGLMARIVLYFSVSQLVFLPNAVSYMGMKDLRLLAVSGVFVLAVSYFVVFILGDDSCGILPYRFVWE